MSQTNRIQGGLIDRNKSLSFSFDAKAMTGYAGDTLASALMANGVKLVGRSFKYHRPRGIFSAGSEEPNALVQLRRRAYREPNTRATVAELFDGLEAASQNYRGSLRYDLLAANDFLSPFLSAGFYYKTFMWPKAFWEKLYEPAIRASAGLGRLSGEPDPDAYDKGFLHGDLLIVGAGPAGLSAALTAGRNGARVILADEDFLMGGRLNAETHEIGDDGGSAWAASTVAELGAMDNVRLLTRTTVYGAYDHGVYGALERMTDHLPDAGGKPRQVLWRIYSKRAILCAGATERSIAFGANDRPGVMLAGAARAYVNRFGVAPGKRVGVFTNNDDGWRTAMDLAARGVEVAAVVDVRDKPQPADIPGARIRMGGQIVTTRGRKSLKAVTLYGGETLAVDCLAVSGGWNPNVHLTCHQRGRPAWREKIAAFVPGEDLPVGMTVAGAANGGLSAGEALASGQAAAVEALNELGRKSKTAETPRTSDETVSIAPFWHVADGKGRAWLDLQNDVTVKDVRQAHQEGYRSVELLKRYTTLGMATDQGKTSNVAALAVLADVGGRSIPETGAHDLSAAVFAGGHCGLCRPGARQGFPPGQACAQPRLGGGAGGGCSSKPACGCGPDGFRSRAKPAGGNPWTGRSWRRAARSAFATSRLWARSISRAGTRRNSLNRLYVNGFTGLPVGKVRYGLMLREDGMVYDDGTTARLGEDRYVMTTTTANAVLVYRNMEFARQCLWPGLDVHIVSVTEQWAQFAVAGPNSRKLLRKIVDTACDISGEAFPFMACGEVTVCGGTPGRLFRISFSGELAYEIAVPARYGESLMRALMAAEKSSMPWLTALKLWASCGSRRDTPPGTN